MVKEGDFFPAMRIDMQKMNIQRYCVDVMGESRSERITHSSSI